MSLSTVMNGDEWLKKYFKQANIDVVGSCHLLRHAMVTHMLDHGADI